MECRQWEAEQGKWHPRHADGGSPQLTPGLPDALEPGHLGALASVWEGWEGSQECGTEGGAVLLSTGEGGWGGMCKYLQAENFPNLFNVSISVLNFTFTQHSLCLPHAAPSATVFSDLCK